MGALRLGDWEKRRLIQPHLFPVLDVELGLVEDVFEVVADEAAIDGFGGVVLDDAVAVLVVVPAFAGVAVGGVEEEDFDAHVGDEELFLRGAGGEAGHGDLEKRRLGEEETWRQ
jgi:hypothetical protein